MKFSELYKILQKDGWYIKREGRHYLYAHPYKKGLIPVGRHKKLEVPTGTLNQILKKAGLK
jgi:predicted RNA binding protein YcfA (HicA-like mRNA interferase family)